MEIGFPQEHPSNLFIDNQTAKKISKNPELHKCSQHIDRQYQWIRKQIELSVISMHWVPLAENLACIAVSFTPRSDSEGSARLLRAPPLGFHPSPRERE
jgi:hypothetical protein